ncbi:MAG: serine hydrolase, partial [Patescibacteria group bacterium]
MELDKFNNKEAHSKRKYNIIIISLVVLVVGLAAGNVWAIFYYVPMQANQVGEQIKNKYKFLNPMRNLIKQEDLIINFQPLRDYLKDKYAADQNISVYFEYLPTGASIAINKDAEFYSASLLKVPVAMAVAKKIEKSEWKWTNELVLMSPDKDEHFGNLYKEKTGATFTIEELIRRSLSDSDN